MRYVLIRLDFFSPYTSVPFLAEHGRGNVAPPPSTLIGALAATYYYPIEKDVFEEVMERVRYVSFWVPRYTTVENISRHFTGFSQRDVRLKVIAASLKVVETKALDEKAVKVFKNYGGLSNLEGFISTYSPLDIARAALQILYQPASRLEVYYYGPAYVLYIIDNEKLAEYAKYIFRVGPKESLVAVTPVRVDEVLKHDDEVRTRFYVPVRALEGECNYELAHMAWRPGGDPFESGVEPFCVPPAVDEMRLVAFKSGWTPVKLVTEDGEFQTVVPEDVLP